MPIKINKPVVFDLDLPEVKDDYTHITIPRYLEHAKSLVSQLDMQLHGLIRLWSYTYGYATGTNMAFSQQVDCSPKSVSRSLNTMCKLGFIDIENPNSWSRKITISKRFVEIPFVLEIIKKSIAKKRKIKYSPVPRVYIQKCLKAEAVCENNSIQGNIQKCLKAEAVCELYINTNTVKPKDRDCATHSTAARLEGVAPVASKGRLRKDQLPQVILGFKQPVAFKAKGEIKPNQTLGSKLQVTPEVKAAIDAWNNLGLQPINPTRTTYDKRCKMIRSVLDGKFYAGMRGIPEEYIDIVKDITNKKITLAHMKMAFEKFAIATFNPGYKGDKKNWPKLSIDRFFHNSFGPNVPSQWLFLHFIKNQPEETATLNKDANPNMTNALIREYIKVFLKGNTPTLPVNDHNKFIQTTDKLIEFYTANKKNWDGTLRPTLAKMPELLITALASTYQARGIPVQYGHLFSPRTMQVVFPQWLANQGYFETQEEEEAREATQTFTHKIDASKTHEDRFKELVMSGRKADGSLLTEQEQTVYQMMFMSRIPPHALRYVGAI